MTVYFDILFILIITSGLLVISSRNSIVSVLFLIIVYLLSAVCFLSLGAEFIALLLVLVYIGAISILFLFMIMMLNLRIVEVSHRYITHIPIGIFLGVFFILEFYCLFIKELNIKNTILFTELNEFMIFKSSEKSNLNVIGEIFFNDYNFLLWYAGLILLLVMVGTIVLTLDFQYRKEIRKKILYQKNEKKKISFWA